MRAWLERRLQAIWYRSDRRPPAPLRGLSHLYRLVVRRRARTQRAAAQHPGVPVVVVGNLSVGGSGKSPLVLWLAESLAARGWQPGIVSRGYGGKPGPEPLLLDRHSQVAQVGDEALMLWRRCRLPIAVHPDRVRAARRLIESGVNLIISDDGLQHWRLRRDIEIVVVDAARGHGNGHLLPAGPLREDLDLLQQVDFVVYNGLTDSAQWSNSRVPMRLIGSTLKRLDQPVKTMPLANLAGRQVDALAGIGHPQRFFTALEAAGLEVIPHPFADHHNFRASDLTRFDNRWLVMTEKDAVKCQPFAVGQQWWQLPVVADLPTAFGDAVQARLEQLPSPGL